MPQEIIPTGTSVFDTNMSLIQTMDLTKYVQLHVLALLYIKVLFGI